MASCIGLRVISGFASGFASAVPFGFDFLRVAAKGSIFGRCLFISTAARCAFLAIISSGVKPSLSSVVKAIVGAGAAADKDDTGARAANVGAYWHYWCCCFIYIWYP